MKSRKPAYAGRGRHVPAGQPHSHAELVIRRGAYLPHWTCVGAAYAVTFRLADSIPRSAVTNLRTERLELEERARHRGRSWSESDDHRLAFLESPETERLLDRGAGECWMNSREVAGLVAGALQRFDGARYRLFAWAVMPNHVHAVVQPFGPYLLPHILHSWKSYTGLAANRLLGRSGAFWMSEYYDHMIRDEADLFHAIGYVLGNPLAAELEDWEWVGAIYEGWNAYQTTSP